MEKILTKSVLFLFFCFSLSLSGFSQFSSTFDFNGTNCASNSITAQPANTVFSNISLTNISCASGNGTTLNTQNWTTASSADASAYIEFTITPNTGYQTAINGLSFKIARSSSGPTTVDVAHNASGSFSSSTTFSSVTTAYTTYSWYPNISYKNTAITFRIYGYNASVLTGAKQLKIDQISIDGVTTLLPQPTIQSTISASSITLSSMNLSFSGGDGTKRIVLAKAGSAVNSPPVDLTDYTANSQFGLGSQIGSGNYVIYNGSGNTVTVSGLTSYTTYYYAVYEYNDNGVANSANYLTTSPGTTNAFTTLLGTYIWTGSVSNSWNNSNNWSPVRTSPSSSDILVFNKGGNITINSIVTQTIAQLSISNSTALTLSPTNTRTLTISGSAGTDVNIASGSSLSLGISSNLILNIGANTFVADGDITAPTTGSQITGTGSVTINGTFTTSNTNGFSGGSNTTISNTIGSLVLGAASTVNYTGAAQTVSTGTNYQNLTLSGSGNKTIGANLTVLGNLTLSSSAVLNPQTFDVSIGGNWNSYAASAFTESTGAVVFNGTSPQTVTCTGGESFNNLTIASSGGVSLSSTVSIANVLTLSSGTLTTNGNLQLNLDATKVSGTAGTISGNITIYKNVASLGSHYLGIPLGSVDANQINDDAAIINPVNGKTRLFSYVGPNYAGITNLSTTLTPFTGYSMYFSAGSISLDYSGTYDHTATYSTNFSNTTSAFQLVGNPYLSALDWNASSGWTKTNFNDALYIWNASTNSYASYVGGSGSNGGTQYIPSLQGFFVQTNGTGGTATIGVTNSVCSTLSNPSMLRVGNAISSSISIKVAGENCSDEALIHLSDDGTSDYDNGFDASKMTNPGATPSISSVSNGNAYSINTLSSNDDLLIPINITFPVSGLFDISFNVPNSSEKQFILIDKTTGNEQLLSDDYALKISADDNSVNSNYALRVGSTNSSSLSVQTSTGTIYSFDKTIYISGFTGNISQIYVNDILGNTVLTPTDLQSSMTINGAKLTSGIYIVNVVCDGKITTNKVIIK